MNPIIGLAVPGLALGGGVPAVARFIRDTIARSGRYELRLISLCMSSHDPCSTSIGAPHSWLRGATSATGEWKGTPYTHVGAVAGELEFQRYRPRAALTKLLADCDLIQVVCGSPAWANAVVGLGKPVAVHAATRATVERRARSATARGPKGWWRRGMTAITNQMDDRALRQVDAIQVMNPWMLDYARGLNATRDVDIRYAPPGVDARRFCPAPAPKQSDDPYILCVGRLGDPRKNVGLLLDAYARLPATVRESTRLILAGASSPPPVFWQRADALGLRDRIQFIERPNEAALIELYQHASVFALPSDEEGFGMVVIEATACGLPVVATRCGGPDGIITDGKDGYLVARGDADAMAAHLRQLLQDRGLNAALGRAARITVEQRYDERIAGEVFVDMWDRLLHRGMAR